MYRLKRAKNWHLFLIVLGLLTIGIWSACRSDVTPVGLRGGGKPAITVSASADIIIVERGSPRLARVQAVPAHVVLAPGETIGLSAVAFDQQGRELKQATFSWQLLNSQAGAITPSGVFRAGFAQGTFNDAILVTARAPIGGGPMSVQGTANVTVAELKRQIQPTSIRLFPQTAEVEPRETLHLVALAVDANGVVISNRRFNWEILEPLAGSVSQDGRLTASENIGAFPRAIRVTLKPEKEDGATQISASLDVRITDPASVTHRVVATVLPQVISLRPQEEIRFTAMLLDRRGNRLPPVEPGWEVLDARAGVISRDGRFRAGDVPGIYPDAVRVSTGVAGMNEKASATGTVVIVGVMPPVIPKPSQLPRVVIFPDRVVLSPGESTRVSIIGLEGDVQRLSTANVRWSLSPPEVGEVSQFVNVTAHDFPGIYEGAIHAEVTIQTDNGPVTQEVSATLVIRDALASVQITPQAASLARGEKMQFQALAYDRNNVMLPDVFFKWKVADPAVGSIDANGLFMAKGLPGLYSGVVQVQAQR